MAERALVGELGEQAHKLVREYLECTDAAMREELLVALENVIHLFRELQPAPVFKKKLWVVE